MFYDRFKELCEKRGISCNRAAIEMGLSNATPTQWKNRGLTPKADTLAIIAKYFNVSTDYLLEQNKEKPPVNDDEELTEYIQMLKDRPECRMLFQLSKSATKEDVEQAVKIIEAIRKK